MVILNPEQIMAQYKAKFMTKLPVISYISEFNPEVIAYRKELEQEEMHENLVDLFADKTNEF